MAVLNEMLSNWSGVHCWCGLHEWHGRRQAYVSSGTQGKRVWSNTGQCGQCDWDLSLTPYQNLRAVPAAEWDNSLVRNSCFYQEARRDGSGPGWAANGLRAIMPAGVTGAEFLNCNLDNCRLPAGATMIEQDGVPTCSRRRIRVQNDRRDWLLDANGDPTEPVTRRQDQQEGRNVAPGQIPGTPISDNAYAAEEARAKRWRGRRREGLRRRRDEGHTTVCECVVDDAANQDCPSCQGRGYRHPLMPEGVAV